VADSTAGSSKYYFIVSQLNGLYLDIKHGSKDPGARLIMWHKTGGDNQLWYANNGRIRSKLNGFCLEIEGNTTVFWIQQQQQLLLLLLLLNSTHLNSSLLKHVSRKAKRDTCEQTVNKHT